MCYFNSWHLDKMVQVKRKKGGNTPLKIFWWFSFKCPIQSFDECANKDADHLAEELSSAVNVQQSVILPRGICCNSFGCRQWGEKQRTPQFLQSWHTTKYWQSNFLESWYWKLLLPQINLNSTKNNCYLPQRIKVVAKKCKKDSSLMQSCDDCLVSGKRNYPNLYSFVIKTVTECTVLLSMILRDYYCITSSMAHYHFVIWVCQFLTGKKRKKKKKLSPG